ncbi:hypothetical protein HDU91_005650 [Kappamyces sp. JEL0680]|nr:hypothetical protein HDU91_005650 [Kappamyces sp. JEL0680]
MSFPLDEIAKHCTPSDCWVVIHHKVFNMTQFLNEHPGGKSILLSFAGKDATARFTKTKGHDLSLLHSRIAQKYYLGEVAGGPATDKPARASKTASVDHAKITEPNGAARPTSCRMS